MKTILVDAVDTLISAEGVVFEAMHEMLNQYPNDKIVVTNANDEQFKTFNLDVIPYPIYTLKHEPDKTDPTYFTTMLAHFELKPENVIYFEHNADAVKSAESVGITSYFYDHTKQDLEALKSFLDVSL